MANRKVLINYHTSGSTAPEAANVFKGELVVAHETGKETIFTKNNANEMVPFISCAQTIAIIESKIQSSDTDVMVKAGEQHLEVSAGTGDEANKFTLNTKDVQSEEEFKAYSAQTHETLSQMTDILTALTDVVVTGISGDTIIVAEKVDTSTGTSNTYNLTHREAKEVALGFNKVATDKYGHVIDYSAVTTADIQALGFKTSAETGEDLAELSASVVANETHISELSAGTIAVSGDIVTYVNALSANTHNTIKELSAGTVALGDSVFASAKTYTDEEIEELSAVTLAAIEALDSETAVTAGKYLTGIAIADGKISGITEADLPTLSVESAGTGNVVASIAVDGHKITYQTASVATSEGIAQLSAATIALSAGTIHDIEALSGDVISYVKVVSGDIETVINELSAGTQADLEKLSAGTIADNNKLSADVITYINTISGYAHGEIVELSGAVQANETDIDNLSSATLDLSAVTLTGVSLNNTPLTVTDHVVSVPVTTSGSGIAAAENSGSVADAKAVKEYVENILSSSVDYKGATDSEPSNPSKGDLWIAASAFTVDGQNAEVGDFIIYNGSSWDVIEKNLDGAITGNLTQDTVTLGDSTNSVKSLANGANGTVLTMVDGAPAWANDPELSVVSAGTGNVISDITVSDHQISLTKGVTAASNADLQTLSGATEAISGFAASQIAALSAGTIQLSADTKAAIAELSAGTIQLSADTKAAIAELSAGTLALSANTHNKIVEVYGSANSYADAAILAAIEALDSVGSASTTGHYLTSVTITDGKITAVGEVAVPAAVAITATTATPVDTASAVLTGVTASGTDNHELTFGMSNKVFSAVTSDSAVSSTSAVTSQSAQTTVSANMAYELSSAATITSGQVTDLVDGIKNVEVLSATTAKSADTAASADKVAHALSATDGTNTVVYDGSTDKTLTFGTATSSTGVNDKSMSITSAGVVDVEVIDCGEY